MSVARRQAQIFLGLLDALRPHWRSDAALPARIHTLLAKRREFGSRDRRLYRELIYTTLRYLPWIEPKLDEDPDGAVETVASLAASLPATQAFRRELAGDRPVPTSLADRASLLGEDPDALLPAWFRAECPVAFTPNEREAMLARAPLWIRLQTDDSAAVAAEFASRGWSHTPAAALPEAWRLPPDVDVTATDAYTAGHFEVQDIGSQFVLASIGIEPGGHWLDACAGAGGKTLQLARLLGPNGRVHAEDVRRSALSELEQRARRAGLRSIMTRVTADSGPGASGTDTSPYDGVLIDAPCSGSGTWRRSPHLKWVTTPATVAERAATQRALLRSHAARVRPGGRLVYATCSLARSENEAVIADFLATSPEFSPAGFANTFGFETTREGLTILPARHDSDGFFVASLRRREHDPRPVS